MLRASQIQRTDSVCWLIVNLLTQRDDSREEDCRGTTFLRPSLGMKSSSFEMSDVVVLRSQSKCHVTESMTYLVKYSDSERFLG